MAEERDTFIIKINPENKAIAAEKGLTYRAALSQAGIYFPQNCSGKGQCGHCRITFHNTPPLLLPREIELLGEDSLHRLACLHKVDSDSIISLPRLQEWRIEKNISGFDFAGLVCHGCGIAIDLGTTVIALYLVNFDEGGIAAQFSLLNPQVHLGGDVMTRLDLAKNPERRTALTEAVRTGISEGIRTLLALKEVDVEEIRRLYLAGNTTMMHLFLGMSGEGLEVAPFRSPLEGQSEFDINPAWIGLIPDCACNTAPVIQGFIGGDTAAAIIATDLDRNKNSRMLIDLGTNGEIVLSAKGSLYAASTAAGPAFEGVGMHDGMPAMNGAIEGFDDNGDPFVIGGGEPVGFCGSGYIAALAMLLKQGKMDRTGLLERDSHNERRWSSVVEVEKAPVIVQDDVRKFQLAKGAIAAGINILSQIADTNPEDLDEIIITGSFGNRIDPQATIDIGLIPEIPVDRVTFMDNAAGRGALLCLGNGHFQRRAEQLKHDVKVINLAEHPEFQNIFVSNMSF